MIKGNKDRMGEEEEEAAAVAVERLDGGGRPPRRSTSEGRGGGLIEGLTGGEVGEGVDCRLKVRPLALASGRSPLHGDLAGCQHWRFHVSVPPTRMEPEVWGGWQRGCGYTVVARILSRSPFMGGKIGNKSVRR